MHATFAQTLFHSLQSLTFQQVADGLWTASREVGGQSIGVILGFLVSWFLLIRKRRLALARLTRGDSDDVLYQAHFLVPVAGTGQSVLLFRNLAPTLKLTSLYDNPAAQDIARKLADKTTLENPVLQTEGTLGFEVLNDAFIHIAGHLALASVERESWLFVM
ncbi:MAG: hypothetical protein ACOYMN_21180, partial [Roseimicrobium sp.]